MGLQKFVLLLISTGSFFAYKTKNDPITNADKNHNNVTTTLVTQTENADLLLKKTVSAHGGDLYDTANYSFNFRGDAFYFKNDHKNFEYSKTHKKEKNLTQDFLKNGVLTRKVNNKTSNLSENSSKRAKSSLNSVIYFATLPHKLNDEAVNKTYIGETSIKGENYAILGITFNKEGGGEDFDDQFHYWINAETNKIDYLAYNYKVNGGGVRFRSAFNRRVVDGITFQDYINYKANPKTPLVDLPKLYEAGELKELSKIKTENVINLNNKQK